LRVDTLVAFAAFTILPFGPAALLFVPLVFALLFAEIGALRGRDGFGAGFFAAGAGRAAALFLFPAVTLPERAPRLEATLAFFVAAPLLRFAGALLLLRAADCEPFELFFVAILLFPPENATAPSASASAKSERDEAVISDR
jgi:hypothetical protein